MVFDWQPLVQSTWALGFQEAVKARGASPGLGWWRISPRRLHQTNEFSDTGQGRLRTFTGEREEARERPGLRESGRHPQLGRPDVGNSLGKVVHIP